MMYFYKDVIYINISDNHLYYIKDNYIIELKDDILYFYHKNILVATYNSWSLEIELLNLDEIQHYSRYLIEFVLYSDDYNRIYREIERAKFMKEARG